LSQFRQRRERSAGTAFDGSFNAENPATAVRVRRYLPVSLTATVFTTPAISLATRHLRQTTTPPESSQQARIHFSAQSRPSYGAFTA
jgi:hypothetical protein